jgi:hypothetical protein
LAKKYQIEKIGYLQTDTEGLDASILNGVLDYYEKYNLQHQMPDLIQFESNRHNNGEEQQRLRSRLQNLGYDVKINDNGEDTRATRSIPKFLPKTFY